MKNIVQYSVGETIKYNFCPESEVVGIDRYTMKTFDGRTVRWDSYTLTSEGEAPFARWWIVNVPECGPHFFLAAADIPKHAVFDASQSGLVALNSEGNFDLSSAKGALASYRDKDGVFYSQEVFDGAERLVFVGRPFPQG